MPNLKSKPLIKEEKKEIIEPKVIEKSSIPNNSSDMFDQSSMEVDKSPESVIDTKSKELHSNKGSAAKNTRKRTIIDVDGENGIYTGLVFELIFKLQTSMMMAKFRTLHKTQKNGNDQKRDLLINRQSTHGSLKWMIRVMMIV